MRATRLLVSLLLLVLPSRAAQDAAERSPFEPAAWGVVYDVPATADVVKRNLVYHRAGERELTLDLYLPPAPGAAPLPGVVFLNTIGDRLPDRVKDWGIYSSWPRLVAAHGLAGISMDCDGERVDECLTALFAFLEREGARHGVDGSRLGTYAASANASEAGRFLMAAGAPRGVRAAVFYYGWPEVEAPRRDLPVLLVTPESDLQPSRDYLTALFGKVLASGAPWTLEFATDLPHAFDAFSDVDASRRIIQRTLAFWRSQLEPVPPPPWEPSPARAILAAQYGNDTPRMETLLADWIAQHPDDSHGYAARGIVRAQERKPGAKTDLERALALGSQEPGVFGCLGAILAHERQYAPAVEHLQRAIAGGWYSSELYGLLGMSQLMLGATEAGVQSYERALQLGVPPGANTVGLANYNLACGYARLGRVGDALGALERAVAAGFGTVSGIEGDQDLAPLRGEERYVMLLDGLAERGGR